MTSSDHLHPFTLDVLPLTKPAGHFGWEIRKHGKLLQRSDRPHPSKAKAQERGLAEIERHLTPSRDGR